MNKTLIIGLGTGRCGTKTLAALLDMQPGAHVTHELFAHNLTWDVDPAFVGALADEFAAQDHRLFGDIALNWLPYAELFLKMPEARFIVLQREILATVESLLYRAGDRDWWREGAEPSDWFRAMPTYSGCETKRDAVIRYYSEYYERCNKLAWIYRSRFLWVQTEALSSEKTQRRILEFVGYAPEEMRLDTRLNIRTKGEYREVTR